MRQLWLPVSRRRQTRGLRAGAGNGAPPADEAPKLLSAKPQLNRAPTRGGVRGSPGQRVDPNSIPAGGCASSPHMRTSAQPVCTRVMALTSDSAASPFLPRRKNGYHRKVKAKSHPDDSRVREAHCS